MKHFWAELRPKLRNKLSEFEAMIVAPNTEEVLAQIELRFPARRADGDLSATRTRSSCVPGQPFAFSCGAARMREPRFCGSFSTKPRSATTRTLGRLSPSR